MHSTCSKNPGFCDLINCLCIYNLALLQRCSLDDLLFLIVCKMFVLIVMNWISDWHRIHCLFVINGFCWRVNLLSCLPLTKWMNWMLHWSSGWKSQNLVWKFHAGDLFPYKKVRCIYHCLWKLLNSWNMPKLHHFAFLNVSLNGSHGPDNDMMMIRLWRKKWKLHFIGECFFGLVGLMLQASHRTYVAKTENGLWRVIIFYWTVLDLEQKILIQTVSSHDFQKFKWII